MARPSKLTDAQWHEIEKRMLAGEKAAALAKEFKVDRSTISQRLSPGVKNVKVVANQMLEAEYAFKALPVSQQIATVNLMDELRAISTHLAVAAKNSAMSANKLTSLANLHIEKITEDNLTEPGTGENLMIADKLQAMANEASKIPMGLLNANKDQVQRISIPDTSALRDMTDDELFAIASRSC